MAAEAREHIGARADLSLYPRVEILATLEAKMGRVLVDFSMSLDGFIAGPHERPGNPLGDGGRTLFDWWTAGTERVGPDERFKPPARSRAVVREMFERGAIIAGRRWFDIANGWGGHLPGAESVTGRSHSRCDTAS